MISIIIPTLNEAENLPGTLRRCIDGAAGAEIEFIVSDCDSIDGTAVVARQLGAQVVVGGKNRADALNRGANLAHGEVLLFLHADSLPPDRFPHRIERALARPDLVGGAFEFTFSDPPQGCGLDRHWLSVVVLVNRVRYRFAGTFFGDQGIFVRRDVFWQLGGFPRLALMEDLQFSQRLNRAGRTAILCPPMNTSPRRFLAKGVWRQLLTDLFLISCDSFGLRPGKWWNRYNDLNRNEHQSGQESAIS